MVQQVIEAVNSKNGGPITEGKLLHILDEERATNIKKDIEQMQVRLLQHLEPKIEENKETLEAQFTILEDMNQRVI